MRKNKSLIICVSLLLISFLLFTSSCNNATLENVNIIDPKVVEVTENYIDSFWDDDFNYFYQNNLKIPAGAHRSGPAFGRYSDFWVEAQHWQTVMDIYDRQGGEYYLDLINKVYEGFKFFYPNFKNNIYNDDIGWWALGCTRAYIITGNQEYLDDAKEMFDYIYESYSTDLGGGIYWTTDRTGKNVCTSAPASITASRLSVLLNDPTYLEKSISLFSWIRETFYVEETGRLGDSINFDSSIYDGQHSYNYGTFVQAAFELYLRTNDSNYLLYTEKPLDYFLSISLENGIMAPEGEGDGAAFRTIFFRALNLIAKTSRPDYQEIINNNALSTYTNRRESDSLCGYNWAEIPSEDMVIRSIAYSASVSLFQFYKP